MKTFSNKEIENFVRFTIRDAMKAEGMDEASISYNWNKVKVQVERNAKDEVRVTCGKMYDPPPLNLGMLLKFADFFGTKNINDDRFSYGGCETCDYGSEYGFTLIIKPEKV